MDVDASRSYGIMRKDLNSSALINRSIDRFESFKMRSGRRKSVDKDVGDVGFARRVCGLYAYK